MPALYRQYRPQTFSDISGQEHVVGTLAAAIEKDRVAHAYLFQGPRGTGKTTTARVFAKRLNCVKPKSAEPCGKCAVCLSTAQGKNMDIIEIDAASNRGIDDIRSLRETVALSPTVGTYKIYIIDEVHMLTNEAFAALLKTLEEPVKHAVFILATTELHKVPETILSRCQVFRFRRASDDEMMTRLQHLLKKEKRKIDKEVLQFITQRSDGCYRDAESLLGQMLTVHTDGVSLDAVTSLLGLPAPDMVGGFLVTLVNGDSEEAVGIVDGAYKDGFDPEQFIQESIRVGRDGALAQARRDKSLPPFAALENSAARLPIIIRALIQASQDLAYVPQPMIALQLAILSVCAPKEVQTSKTEVKNTSAPQATAPLPKVESPQPSPQPAPSISKVVESKEPEQEDSAPRDAKPSVSPEKSSDEPSAFSVQDVVASWDDVIGALKKSNPVSSTFLRATEPVAVEGRQVTLRAQFPLHKNFFDKADHKIMVEKALSEVLGQEASIRCELEETGLSISGHQEEKRKQEQQFAANVSEVFGLEA